MALPLNAGNLPWLPIPQTGTISLTNVTQEAEKFWAGSHHRDLPFGELEQKTTWFHGEYGFNDYIKIDYRFGISETQAGAAGSDEGGTDQTIGVTFRFMDEDISRLGISQGVRFAATLAGNYDTGMPFALGDGADSFSFSYLIGKFITPNFALAGEIELIYREDIVHSETDLDSLFIPITEILPSETKLVFTSLLTPAAPLEELTVFVHYSRVDSEGHLDIGGPGFDPELFPEVEEDITSFTVGARYNLRPNFNIDLSYSDILDGTNTADFSIISIGASYTFDFFRM